MIETNFEACDYQNDEDFIRLYTPLTWKVARTMQKSYRLPDEDVEDIVQNVLMRLMNVPVEMRRHGAYVRTCINNAARNYLSRSILRHGKCVSGDDIGADGMTVFDHLGTDTTDEDLTKQFAQEVFNSLTLDEKLVATLRLGLNGDRPIANLVRLSILAGIPTDQIPNVLESAIQKMREKAGVETELKRAA